MSLKDDENSDIPAILYDDSTRTAYKRLRFFGKGSFGKCYEIYNVETNDVYAGKIISKKLIKENQKKKITQEITIHRDLSHKNVVKFHSAFEDNSNIYIILELCKKRSMMELFQRRKSITADECRYYIHQIIEGVKYLHDKRIIHRDLKLSNLFLSDMLHVKIGDFGLATHIEYEGERKMSLCGSPNYIAPEILTKSGHSFEVDIWSIGCIMYTLLVGQPPFETKTTKETYNRIQRCEYKVPNYLQTSAANMIVAMLQSDPKSRPTINDLFNYEFIACTLVPPMLPSSCLITAPRATSEVETNRQPLTEHNFKNNIHLESTFLKNDLHDTIISSPQLCLHIEYHCTDLQNLQQQLISLIKSKPILLANNLGEENTDSAAQPLFWISKWIDYSTKYGFSYQLCNGSMGVMFNDTTKLILFPNQITVNFIDEDGKENYMTTTNYSKDLEQKMELLRYFKCYMSEHLVTAGVINVNTESDQISRMPHLNLWFLTKYAAVMHLTNGSLQLNFSDHIKIILCPRMAAITYIDHEKNFRTYRFSTIMQYGCSKDLYEKILYAQKKLNKMLEKIIVN